MSTRVSQLVTGLRQSLLSRHCAHLVPLSLILAWVVGSSSVCGQETTAPASLQPADVFVRVAVVRAELELIRLEMGKPRDGSEYLQVSNAVPREVFYQALALFGKSNRLCFEHTRTEATKPAMPTGQVQPQHVYRVVETALTQLGRVKEKLGIVETVPSPARDASKTPTDVFRSILAANKQLNLLLDRQYAPSDVYEQVTLAIGYTSRLLASFPGATRIPPGPGFERRKRPVDVHDRLYGCFELVRSIAQESGLQVATLTRAEGDIAAVAPSDVYGLATLVVSEVGLALQE